MATRIGAAVMAAAILVGSVLLLAGLAPETNTFGTDATNTVLMIVGEEDVTVDPTIAIYERNTDDYICDTPALADLYNGLVADVAELVVVNDNWFEEYADVFNRPHLASAVHTEGVIRIRGEHCDLINEGPQGSRRHLVYFDLMVHEAAHALDFKLGWLSESIEFPEVDLGHANTFASPNRELFAFCMQRLAMNQDVHGTGRCPEANLEVTINAVEAALGIDAQEFVLDLDAYAPVSVADPAQQVADAAMAQMTAGL